MHTNKVSISAVDSICCRKATIGGFRDRTIVSKSANDCTRRGSLDHRICDPGGRSSKAGSNGRPDWHEPQPMRLHLVALCGSNPVFAMTLLLVGNKNSMFPCEPV